MTLTYPNQGLFYVKVTLYLLRRRQLLLLPNSGLPLCPQDGLFSIDFSSCTQFQKIITGSKDGPAGTEYHPLITGVKNMSKEQKNKRDVKKKAAMSPKEKKAAKQSKKEAKNVLGN